MPEDRNEANKKAEASRRAEADKQPGDSVLNRDGKAPTGFDRDKKATPEVGGMATGNDPNEVVARKQAMKEERSDMDGAAWKQERVELVSTKRHYTKAGKMVVPGEPFSALKGEYPDRTGKKFELPPYLSIFQKKKVVEGA